MATVTTFGGLIKIDPNLSGGWKDETNALVHEVVESYYAVVYGVRSIASQRMDYIAQWFAGEFQYESNNQSRLWDDKKTNGDDWGAYGLSFDAWTKTDDFKNYSSQIPIQPDGSISRGGILPGMVFMDDHSAVAVNAPHIRILDEFYWLFLV